MKALRTTIRRITGLLVPGRRDREITAEIESSLQLHVDDLVRTGLTQEQARREARVQFGALESIREECRDRGGVPWLEHLLQDLRFALRQFGKSKAFTLTAIFTLGWALCASVAIFAFVDATLLRPLPYSDPNRLVGVYEFTQKCPKCNLSYLDYLDWKKRNSVFESFAAYNSQHFMLRTRSGTADVRAARVSEDFFRTLGVRPVLGHDFPLTGVRDGSVLLSYGSWKRRFGGGPRVVGETLRLDDHLYTVIGILPAEFQFAPLGNREFWTTLDVHGSCEQRRSCHNLYGVARLKPNVSLETARANAAAIARQLEKEFPASNLGQASNILPLREVISGDHRAPLLALQGATALLLLIACVNVASLLLVRSEGRRRELGIRSALGASRLRLTCQFMVEGAVLVVLSTAVGLVLARWIMVLLRDLIPEDMRAYIPYMDTVGLNVRVLVFAGFIAFAAAVIVSIIPMTRGVRSDIGVSLAEGGRGAAGTTWRRVGSKLVIIEFATAMVLLVGAGLLGKSFYQLLQMKLGFQPERLATMEMAAPVEAYRKPEQSVRLVRSIISRISNLPGIESVGICSQLPVSYNGNTDWIRFVGKPYRGEHNDVNARQVSAGYFRTVQAKLLRGRFFRNDEDSTKPRVVIINQALARMYFGNQDPIGTQIGDDDLTPNSLREIVGVIEDIREGPLDEPMIPTEYVPFFQEPDSNFALVARTTRDETSLMADISTAIHQIDPDVVTVNRASMSALIQDAPSTYLRRSSAWLAGSFAASALLLGVVGLYGVIAYSVSQRTREIGVRMALGAQRGAVYGLVLRDAATITAVGLGIGLACSLGTGVLIQKLLFGVSAWDVQTSASVAILLAAGAFAASYFPAKRAAAVNPVEALRGD